MQCARAVSWHHDVPDAVTKLQQSLKQNVILVIMSDQDVVDDLGKVLVSITGDIALIGIAKNGVKKHANVTGFEQDASMTKVAPTSAFAIIAAVRLRLFGSEKRPQSQLIVVRQRESVADFLFRGRYVLHSKECVETLAGEWQAE